MMAINMKKSKRKSSERTGWSLQSIVKMTSNSQAIQGQATKISLEKRIRLLTTYST
jgi:hypothetical protein